MRLLEYRLFFLCLLVVVFGRLLPHMANATPMTALTLMAPALLGKRLAWLWCVVALIVSDALLGLLYAMPLVGFFTIGNCLAYLAIVWLGQSVNLHKKLLVIGLAGVASLVFWLVSNFFVWLSGSLYANTVTGLGLCYWNALPFLRNAMCADMLWLLLFLFFRSEVTAYTYTAQGARQWRLSLEGVVLRSEILYSVMAFINRTLSSHIV